MSNITYIKDGQDHKTSLFIDGDQVDATDYSVASNIHAIQWNGSSGEIEYNDGTPNKTITDISSFDFETKHATQKKVNEDELKKENEDYFASMTYAEKREVEYPSIENQLDKIYHSGIAGWKTTIKAVKDKYPKG